MKALLTLFLLVSLLSGCVSFGIGKHRSEPIIELEAGRR